jgi:membrane associated rhomboid family serine protease
MPIWRPIAVPSCVAFLYKTDSGDLMNIRRILQPMGIRFFLLVLLMFQLFQLTAYLPASMYWPSHIAALLMGLLFWRLMLKVAKTEQ